MGIVAAGALLAYRRRPLRALLALVEAIIAVELAAHWLGEPPVVVWSSTVILVLVYGVARRGTPGEQLLAASALLSVLAVSVLTSTPTSLDEVIGAVAVLGLAASLGLTVRARAVAREGLVARARAEERDHLARELHDIVAHHVSAIAIQAQAGRVRPETAVEALATIETQAAAT